MGTTVESAGVGCRGQGLQYGWGWECVRMVGVVLLLWELEHVVGVPTWKEPHNSGQCGHRGRHEQQVYRGENQQ